MLLWHSARARLPGRYIPLALALLLCSCNSKEQKPSTLPLPRVRVERAQRGPVDEVVSLTGVLAAVPGKDVKLGALVAGRLARVGVAEGDAIKSGEILAEIEAGPTSDELAQAEATAREAEAAEQAAAAKWKRTEELLGQGAASAQDAEQSRASAISARSNSARAKSAVDLARRKLTRTAIKAPFDGIVVAVLVRGGESVDGNGQPVMEVAATDPVELRAAAPPRDATKLRPGMPAKIRLEGLPVEQSGTVFAIAPAADAASGNVLVRVRAANPEHALRLGMLARASIVVAHHQDAISVPSFALLPASDGGLAVALVKDGAAATEPVSVSFTTDGRAVVSGLDGGEEVISEGGYSLPDGSKVEVVK
jgi:RND family efflux transporter MFP subunit